MKIDIKIVIAIIGMVFTIGSSWGLTKYRIDAQDAKIKSLQREIATDEMLQMMCTCYQEAKLTYYKSKVGITTIDGDGNQ